MTNELWQTKLAARIHDPAEKSLVLLRDPAGHEGGSIVGIGKALGFETHMIRRRDGSQVEKLKLPPEMERVVEQADRWASAADRAQFPTDAGRYVGWAQVNFAEKGELIHPLSGERYRVDGIGQDVLAGHIKAVSEHLFKQLVCSTADGAPDYRKTALAFWRFGSELGRELGGIGHLWSLLPADTRTPDHTIWQHLDLTSALAGAMVHGDRPALLTVSVGPVQEFIAGGRSTSDLWAGSHFLSTLAWQAMEVIAGELGPDAILFPQLRGVPIVDLWLLGQGLNRSLFRTCDWSDTKTDYNPLFSAALPNKFVGIVPAGDGERLAERITSRVRGWAQEEARIMLQRVLDQIGEAPGSQHCHVQLEEQLRGFPEVHWSLVPWLSAGELESALATFYPPGKTRPGLFGAESWEVLNAPVEPEQGWKFFVPNDGTLYSAIHDAGERSLAAAKSARRFEQLQQNGYRDSLTGEHEWLRLDRDNPGTPPGQRGETLWGRVAASKRSWAKEGEHLSAFGLIKRLWPTRYSDWLRKQKIGADIDRYVVSTYVMALAPSLEKLMAEGPADQKAFGELATHASSLDRAALPRRLMKYRGQKWWDVAAKLPTLIEDRRESQEAKDESAILDKTIENALGSPPERYYALILMDGDRLGAWLSGDLTLEFDQSFHSSVRAGLHGYHDERLKRYLELDRPTSPARHMAISSALNGFSLDLVRHVVEDVCLGKVLYAGGDDVMAMVCVRDLLKVLWLLRVAYSGAAPVGLDDTFSSDLEFRRGFVRWDDRLYRAMGVRATASAGAVIAHHMAPLGGVLRALRAAEREAKSKGGRNAFSMRVIKRSGGRLDLTLPWWLGEGEEVLPSMHVLDSLRGAIAEDMSRRVAYHADEWVRRLPLLDERAALKNLIARNLEDQFKRKGGKGVQDPDRIAEIAVREAERRCGRQVKPGALAREAYAVVQALLFTAEFLAREERGGGERRVAEGEKEAVHG